jgi:hypothetical protein
MTEVKGQYNVRGYEQCCSLARPPRGSAKGSSIQCCCCCCIGALVSVGPEVLDLKIVLRHTLVVYIALVVSDARI